MHAYGPLAIGFNWFDVDRRIKSRGQEGPSPGLRSIIIPPLGWEQLREHLMHTAIFLDAFAITRMRLNIDAGESVMGCRDPLTCRLVILNTRRTVPPSSHPCWSAKEKRINLDPLGLKFEAVCGAKLTELLDVTYEAVFLPAKCNPSINLSSLPAI